MTNHRLKIVHSLWICLVASAFVLSLAGSSVAQTYYPPPDSRGGWRTAKTAEEVRRLAGLDLEKVEDVFADYSGSTKNGGLLIVRHGWLAFEKYFGYGCRDATPNLGSCGKSFTSIAVGILMAEHPDLFPDGLDQKIFTPIYLPPEAFPLSDPAKAEIKLGQLLAFSAGIRGNNPGLVRGRRVMLDPPGPDGWQAMVDDVVVGKRDISINGRNTSTKTLWCEPGEGYSYATASAHLASMIVRHVSGMELEPFVRTRLAEPMGWGPFTFAYKHAKEVTHTPGGGGIALRATDMLRFCYLLLHEGRWGDRQIVPPEYVRHCGRKSPYNPHSPYSLQFNVNSDGHVPGVPRDAFWKTGSGGHVLYIIPSLDLIVWKLAGRDNQYKPSNTGVPMAEESVKGAQQRRDFKPAGQISSMQLLQDIVNAVVASARPSGNSKQSSSDTTNRKRIFKRSHIAAWMDEPDSYKMCDVDVLIQDMSMVSDADAERWGRFIDKMHAKGKLVCAEMRPATHMNELLEYVMTDDSLQAAACIDIQGKPIEVPWMVGHIYKGRTPVFLCSNQPRYRQFLRDQVRYFMKAGADGIMVDDGGGSFFAYNRGGCFCKHCMEGFRDYLRKKYSAGQLKQKGIHDIDSFDYRQFILRREGGAQSYQNRKERLKIPFTSDFHDFLVHSDVELFRELQKLSCDLAGKHIPMGWDNVDFGGLRAGYYPFWDVFYSEINYQHFGVDGRIPDTEFSPGIIMLDKFSDAMGKWYIPTPAPRSWEAVMRNDVESLLRLWVAFSYANGSALRYPRKGWIFSKETPWYFPPKKDFEPLYAFIRDHRELFDDYETVEQVGVLFTQNRGGGASRYYTPLKHVCASLVELNMPFGMAVAGDELLADRLKGDEAEQFELMLIPEPIRLIDGQQNIVNRWKERGRAISVKREDDVAKKIGNRVKPLVTVEDDSGVWLFPRYIPGKPDAPVVCHVVNPDFDVKQDIAIPQTNVPVRMLRRLFGNRQINKVTYYTPENEPRTLAFDIDGGNVRVTVPRIDMWGILVFDNAKQLNEKMVNWNQFRGPNGQGVAPSDNIPVHFGPESNVLWKTVTPEGHSSPVIWNSRIFLTGYESADKKELITFCINREDGSILWRQTIQTQTKGRFHRFNNPASSSPAADEKNVYVYFGTFGLICYDHAGNEIWQRKIDTPRTKYGMATSPIVYRDTVIMVLDSDDGSSRMLAVHRDTGQTVWEQPRSLFKAGWSTPVIWRHGETEELIVLGFKRLTSYDPSTGEERWWAGGFPQETVGVPVIGEELLFASGAALGGRGDEKLDAAGGWKITVEKFDRNHDNQIQRDEMTEGFAFIQRPELPIDNPGYGLPIRNMDTLLRIFDRDKNRIITETEWMDVMSGFEASSHPNLMAIRPGATKDARPSHVAWEIQRGIPETPSLLFCRGKLYLLRDGGVLTCLEAATGKELFRERIGAPGQYTASPIALGEKIITASVPGVVTVIQVDDTLNVLARNRFKEKIFATPGIIENKIYLRTTDHLYAFGEVLGN